MTQIFQAINVYFAFAAVVINAVFVVLVLARTSRTTFYLVFLWLCVAAIIWNFGIFMTYFAGRGFWFYIALIGSPLIPALLFHLMHVLVRPASRSNWILLAYVLSGLLSISSFLAIFHHGVKLFVDSVFWNIYFLGVLVPFLLGGMVILLTAIKNAQSGERKNQLRYVFYSIIIGTMMGMTDLIQIFSVPVPKLGHAGSVLYGSVLAVGIFKHRRTYDIIAQMQGKLELLSEMAAGIAHEIRNPLSSIKGASNLLASDLDQSGVLQKREYVGIIREEIMRLDSILCNFQSLTKPMNIRTEPVSINEIIRKTVKLAEVGELSLMIKQDLSHSVPLVQADASLLKQVFLNLIKNASEACNGGGELLITTTPETRGIKVIFGDNGPGIPDGLLGRIFDPFFTTKTSGMGMGLAVSQKIIQAHRGTISVRSEVSRGTAFSIVLPVSAA